MFSQKIIITNLILVALKSIKNCNTNDHQFNNYMVATIESIGFNDLLLLEEHINSSLFKYINKELKCSKSSTTNNSETEKTTVNKSLNHYQSELESLKNILRVLDIIKDVLLLVPFEEQANLNPSETKEIGNLFHEMSLVEENTNYMVELLMNDPKSYFACKYTDIKIAA